MAKLGAKQELFCQEYVKNPNATQAAIKAGYSEKTANKNANRLMVNEGISARIEQLRAGVQKRTEITQDMVVMELANVAFANLGLVCEWDVEGSLTLKEISSVCPRGMAAIQSVESVDSFSKDGEKLSTKSKVRLHDKIKALELLGKHLGIFDGSGGKDKNRKSVSERLSALIKRVEEG